MTKYFPMLETRNRFANDDLWRGCARCAAGACVRRHGGGRSSKRGGGVTRLLLVAAVALMAVFAAAGTSIQDATCAAGGYDLCA